MHRTIILVLALGGCEVGFNASDDTGGDPAVVARTAFDRDVLPLVRDNCRGCHEGNNADGWMKPDAYTTMKSWPHLLELSSPASSQILTKGMHEGPAWKPEQAALILPWIQKERDAQQDDTRPETAAVAVVDGANTMPLDAAGAAGSMVRFTAQKLTHGLYLSNIALSAGTGGVHATHPLFVIWRGDAASPDPVDSFDTVEMDLAQASSGSVGGGLLLLEDIPADAKLSVSFKKLGPSTGGGTTMLPGCKALASFTTNARSPLSTNCARCHAGTDPSATGATDMTKINDTSATGQAAVCGQILGRVNLTTPDQSGIFLAADPNSGTQHPFKFQAGAFTTFKSSVSTWIQAEKAAGP